MRLTVRLALVLLLAIPAAVGAQSLPANVGDNANILPVYKSTPPGEAPAADDYLRGNLLGQRCNEPSIGISSINRDHMMVFCNDYRATFNWDDSLVPSGKTTLVAAVWNGFKTFFAKLTGHKEPRGESEENEKIIASAEAGIGGGVSYDGGITWQGFMVPGGPNDSTPASLAHPGRQLNLQGYSDPWAVSMKDGRVGVTYIGFTRDKVTGQSTQSGVFFTRYRDRNASDAVHDWEYEFSSQVALSQNLTQGQFLDKVSATVAPNGTLYVAYTRFTGSSGSSNIFLAQSVDGGLTWTSASIDKDAKYGQGTVALVHPTDSAAVGVLWRTFVSSTLLYKSTAKGAKNVDLFLNDSDGPYKPFDQYPQAINGDPNRVAFRTLAFPAAAYTPDGTRLVVVFTEWINLDTMKPGTTGRPMPMVVMKVSTDKGATWSRRYVLNQLNSEGSNVPASPQRLGFFSSARAVGAQMMPAVACTVGNQCMVVWKQSYQAAMAVGGSENPGALVTSGFGRRFDVRAALVSFPSTAPAATASFQVSRYGYRELKGTETPSQVAGHRVTGWRGWTCRTAPPTPCSTTAIVNHTGAGKLPFAGDYIGVKEVAAPGASPTFMVAFSDNRYNIWPHQTETGGTVTPGDGVAVLPRLHGPQRPGEQVPGRLLRELRVAGAERDDGQGRRLGLCCSPRRPTASPSPGPTPVLRRPVGRDALHRVPAERAQQHRRAARGHPHVPHRLGLVRQAPLRRDAGHRDELRLPAGAGDGDDLPVLQLLPERLRLQRQPRDRQGRRGDRPGHDHAQRPRRRDGLCTQGVHLRAEHREHRVGLGPERVRPQWLGSQRLGAAAAAPRAATRPETRCRTTRSPGRPSTT